jgi:hypothetical protein
VFTFFAEQLGPPPAPIRGSWRAADGLPDGQGAWTYFYCTGCGKKVHHRYGHFHAAACPKQKPVAILRNHGSRRPQ